MKPNCSIIIPTFSNPQFFIPCVRSIRKTGVLNGQCELIIVNNGQQPIKEELKDWPNTYVLEPGQNLGWERGLQYGLEHTDTDFVCFQNDDTLIPKSSGNFYSQMLWPFHDENVAAVGPATTNASGWHSIFRQDDIRFLAEVPYLIFFTVMVRRSHLEAAGGIDTTAPGGDDLDLSMRLRKMGKKCLINPDAFIIHHAFKTGERVRGTPDVAGGWNSREMIDKTNQWLIQKHGFKFYMETMRGFGYNHPSLPDTEGNMVSSFVEGEKVVELGCGFRKTVPHAIGVDRVGKGEPCNHLDGPPCVADVKSDICAPLPFKHLSVDTVIARHCLEHVENPIRVIKQWGDVLKIGGRLILAVPDQTRRNTIPLNPEHCNSYTPESLLDLMSLLGWKSLGLYNPENGISFIGVFEKVKHSTEKYIVGEVREVVHA